MSDPNAVNPYRAKASERPIDGEFRQLAQEVRWLLGWMSDESRPYLSTRAAEAVTGISNGTIATMARGGRVHRDTLRKFAQKMGADPVRMQRIGGYVTPAETVGMPPPGDEEYYRVLKDFGDTGRFELPEELRDYTHPASGSAHIVAMSTWDNTGAAWMLPLVPFIDKALHYRVVRAYLEALRGGDHTAGQINARYRTILERCIEYAIGFVRLLGESVHGEGYGAGGLGGPTRLLQGIIFAQRQNVLAIIGWYGRCHGDDPALPASIDLPELLASPAEHLEERLPETAGSRPADGLRAFQVWHRLLDQCRALWGEEAPVAAAERRLIEADQESDLRARLLALMYRGLYIAVHIEVSVAPPVNGMPAVAPFAVAATGALIAWWESMESLPPAAPPPEGAG